MSEPRRIVFKRQIHTQVRVEIISLTTLQEEQQDIADSSADPYEILRAKTMGLADLLHCTEAEAERIILNRCHV